MRTRPLPGLLLLSLAGALSACDSDDPTAPETRAPRLIAAAADSNQWNTISAIMTVRAVHADSAHVRFWKGTAPAERTPAFPIGADSVAVFPVLGLDTASSYSLEVNLHGSDGVVAVDTLTFQTGSLPAWIPAFGVQGTDTTPGYFLLSFPNGPVISDNSGTVRWYRFTPGGILNSFQAQPNGRYTSLGVADSSGHLVFDAAGDSVGKISCVGGYKTRFHDLLVTSAGDTYVMCDDVRVMDLSGDGGVAGAVVTGTVVQHLDPAGQLQFEWNVFDHFQITDLPLQDRTGPAVNFTHGNGIALDLDGNLLLSFRSLNEVTKVDATTGSVLWRFGGLANQFTFVNDPKGAFQRQHGLRRGAPGEIQFLDNGSAAPSRLVRYLLNQQTLVATLVMSYTDPLNLFATVGGSTQYYSNGHSTVSFGPVGRVLEVDPAGNLAWEITGVSGLYVFRAQRIQSLYFPGKNDPTR